VALWAAHHDQQGDLESLTVSSCLIRVVGLAGDTEVEMLGLERSRAVANVDNALVIVTVEADVANTVFKLLAVGASVLSDGFVDYVELESLYLLLADNTEILFRDLAKPDDGISPKEENETSASIRLGH
jgi:hypothetical protein